MSLGPGWINDIFDAKFVFEESCYTMVPDAFVKFRDGKEEEMKCFDGKGAISGKLVVTPPDGRTIGHNGIEIVFKSTAYLHDAVSNESEYGIVLKTWVLLEAGQIGEPTEIGFDIDLSELNLRDTFDGAKIGLRHSIAYRIVRPWYTFSVRGEEPIAIRNCPPPADAPKPPEESVLSVNDYGGEATFDHGKCEFSADGRLIGTLSMRNLQPGTTVTEVSLLLGRTEMWAKTSGEDVVVRLHAVHAADRSPITSEVTIPVDISLAEGTDGSEVVSGPLAPSMLPLAATDPSLSASNEVNVTYWLRLLLTTAPKAEGGKIERFWSTHPIRLLPGTDAGSV